VFENVNRFFGISRKKKVKIPQIQKMGCSKVQHWNVPLFYFWVKELKTKEFTPKMLRWHDTITYCITNYL